MKNCGLDLGKKSSCFCIVDEADSVVARRQVQVIALARVLEGAGRDVRDALDA